ncbi:response regulator [candidate division KSB1 bacterium]|nr:response regulator [candidate division KSB1 bacterium]
MKQGEKRILVVDDEESLTWGITKNLQKQYKDYKFYSLNSGEEALSVLKRLQFNLVISDIQMPGTNGLVLLDYVKKHNPEVPVIIMSSLNKPEIKNLANPNTGIYYFEKPFEMVEFKKTISNILRKRSIKKRSKKEKLTLDELIKKNFQKKFNGFVTVKNVNKSGVLHFQGGEIIHAKTDEFEGELALINVLNWKKINYNVVLSNEPVQKTIYYGWKMLIQDKQLAV